jgi:hypothetical protein
MLCQKYQIDSRTEGNRDAVTGIHTGNDFVLSNRIVDKKFAPDIGIGKQSWYELDGKTIGIRLWKHGESFC